MLASCTKILVISVQILADLEFWSEWCLCTKSQRSDEAGLLVKQRSWVIGAAGMTSAPLSWPIGTWVTSLDCQISAIGWCAHNFSWLGVHLFRNEWVSN